MQRLHEWELVVFSTMNIKSRLKERQREVPKVEFFKVFGGSCRLRRRDGL